VIKGPAIRTEDTDRAAGTSDHPENPNVLLGQRALDTTQHDPNTANDKGAFDTKAKGVTPFEAFLLRHRTGWNTKTVRG
jgi:hypothetical protein